MILDVKNRKIKQDGTVILDQDGAMEAIFGTGINDNCVLEGDWVENFITQTQRFDHQPPEYSINHEHRKTLWKMPDQYMVFDIVGWLKQRCQTHEETQRVDMELKLFEERNMLDLLRYTKYLVDTMRENGIVWGVGRGSSVSSYCLYLIGLHSIDAIKYKLDIREFLK